MVVIKGISPISSALFVILYSTFTYYQHPALMSVQERKKQPLPDKLELVLLDAVQMMWFNHQGGPPHFITKARG
jgi:hypothetical protein